MRTDTFQEPKKEQIPRDDIKYTDAPKPHFRNITSGCDQSARQSLMTRVCEKREYKDPPFTDLLKDRTRSPYKMLLVNDKHKVIFCEVPKAACTSWKVLLANLNSNLSNILSEFDYNRLNVLVHDTSWYPTFGFKSLQDYSPEERETRLQNYFKFIVVRNPYSRLISAFENKFSDEPRFHFYHDMVGKYIIKKFRENPSESSLAKGNDARFEELVKFVGDFNDSHILRFDPHWWNIHDICYPCKYRYDYIAKIETLEEDTKEILSHITHDSPVSLPVMNVNARHKNEANKIERMLGALQEGDRERLTRVYTEDLELFGYGANENHEECV